MSRRVHRCVVWSLVLISISIETAGAEPVPPDAPVRTAPSDFIRLLCKHKLEVADTIAPVEWELMADAEDGKLDQFSFDEALLIASGATDRKDRNAYLAQLDQIEAKATEALAGGDEKRDEGDLLLRFLHDDVMASGYLRDQTDLRATLDAGKFNCVSSTALFNLVAARLGHEVRAAAIPEHVFSLYFDGDEWIKVETTNREGFLTDRNPPPSDSNAERREVGRIGLVSILYFNRGVALAKRKNYADAVIASLTALRLDPANDAAALNTVAFLNDWALVLSNDHQYERAIDVVALGLRAAPHDSALLNNHKFIWQEYADWQFQVDGEDAAIAVLRRAAANVPDHDFAVRESYPFEKLAEPLLVAGRMTEAVKIVDRGIAKVNDEARQRLREWKSAHVFNYVLRQMRSHLEAGRYEAALSAISRDAELLDDEDSIRNFQREVYDAWAEALAESKQWPAAVDVYRAALEDLPGDERLSYNAALCFDRWARSHMQAREWEAAIEIYERAIKQFPDASLLDQNRRYCMSRR